MPSLLHSDQQPELKVFFTSEYAILGSRLVPPGTAPRGHPAPAEILIQRKLSIQAAESNDSSFKIAERNIFLQLRISAVAGHNLVVVLDDKSREAWMPYPQLERKSSLGNVYSKRCTHRREPLSQGRRILNGIGKHSVENERTPKPAKI